jgi:hypothetical protein
MDTTFPEPTARSKRFSSRSHRAAASVTGEVGRPRNVVVWE